MNGKNSKILVTNIFGNQKDDEKESKNNIKSNKNKINAKKIDKNYEMEIIDEKTKQNNICYKNTFSKLKIPLNNKNDNILITEIPSSDRQMIHHNEENANQNTNEFDDDDEEKKKCCDFKFFSCNII